MKRIYSVIEISKNTGTAKVLSSFLSKKRAENYLSELVEGQNWKFVISDSELDDSVEPIEHNYAFVVTIRGTGPTQLAAFENAAHQFESRVACLSTSDVEDVLKEVSPGEYEQVKRTI